MLKDIAGRPQEDIEVPAGTSMDSLFAQFAGRFPGLRDLEHSIVLARNHEFASRTETLFDGDEVAFLPPVSGGSGPFTQETVDAEAGHFFALTRTLIDSRAIIARLLRGEDGAVVDFEGVVRNNTRGRATNYLDYECYEPMALKMMAKIGCEIAASHAIGRIAMVHRLGRMQIGETSVLVAVTAPHRRAAFEAAREGIDRLKKLVPIWKKEHFADGEVWVDGEWDESVLNHQKQTG